MSRIYIRTEYIRNIYEISTGYLRNILPDVGNRTAFGNTLAVPKTTEKMTIMLSYWADGPECWRLSKECEISGALLFSPVFALLAVAVICFGCLLCKSNTRCWVCMAGAIRCYGYMSFPEKLTVELMQFGQRVRQLRKHQKLTLQEIERLIGIHNSTLSKIENGMVNVEFQTIVKIAGVLQVELVELFKYDGELHGC